MMSKGPGPQTLLAKWLPKSTALSMRFQSPALLTFCPVPIVVSVVSQVINSAHGEGVVRGIDVKMESVLQFSLLKILAVFPCK